ncbi:MAG: hypothetical protein CMQ49_11635 [Gammaproteobacteria bacterium]|nr:hypothetical protein [Gammaproteobacteria bacterium]
MKLAVQYNEILESGMIASRADLARHLGVSRAKVTQILNLMKLAPEIRDFIANLEESDERLQILTERQLRPLVQCGSIGAQINRFEELVHGVVRSAQSTCT